MKYLLILVLLVISSCGNDTDYSDKTVNRIYDECYKVSENMFKKIPEPRFKNLQADQLCDEDTSFYGEELDKVCLKACLEVFYRYKNTSKQSN